MASYHIKYMHFVDVITRIKYDDSPKCVQKNDAQRLCGTGYKETRMITCKSRCYWAHL